MTARSAILDLVVIAAITAVLYGVALLSVPAAWIVGGLAGLWMASNAPRERGTRRQN